MNSQSHCPALEADDRIGAEAARPASHRESETMARRRFQKPKPFLEGNYWWLRPRDSGRTGSRKRQRIKLAKADMPFREVEKIADDILRPMNQGLGLTGSAMSLSDFMDDTYIPRYLPKKVPLGHPAHLSSSTRLSYRGMINKYLRPDLGGRCLRDQIGR